VPLNPPKPGVSAAEATAAKEASVDAFHLAALVSAGLLVAGAVVNGVGLRGRDAAAEAPGGDPGKAGAVSG
ncbi:MAG TPA: hypothetical protein VIM24_08665, partial [Candidatus Limnocylindrales bacterium]